MNSGNRAKNFIVHGLYRGSIQIPNKLLKHESRFAPSSLEKDKSLKHMFTIC